MQKETMSKKETELQKLSAIVSDLTVSKFWGEVRIKFEDGVPKLVTTSKTQKL